MKKLLSAIAIVASVAVASPASASGMEHWEGFTTDHTVNKGQTVVLKEHDQVLQDAWFTAGYSFDHLPEKGNIRVGFDTRISGKTKLTLRASISPSGAATAQVLDSHGKVIRQSLTNIRVDKKNPHISISGYITGEERGIVALTLSGPGDKGDNPQIVMKDAPFGSRTGKIRSTAYLSQDEKKPIVVTEGTQWRAKGTFVPQGQTVRVSPASQVLGSRRLAGTFDHNMFHLLPAGTSVGLMSHVAGRSSVQARVTTMDDAQESYRLEIIDAAGKMVASGPTFQKWTKPGDQINIEAEFVGTNRGTVRMRLWEENKPKPAWELTAANVNFGKATGSSSMFATATKRDYSVEARGLQVTRLP